MEKRKLLTETRTVKKQKHDIEQEQEQENYVFEKVQGDLLDSDSDVICQQCNCISSKGKGLSEAMFKKFPFANDYEKRINKSDRSKPGTIGVHKSPTEDVTIINMFAQFYPGPGKYDNDSNEKRLIWFKECLDQMGKLPNLDSFSFPHKIGCGLAGSPYWKEYKESLRQFAIKYQKVVKIHKTGKN